MGSSSAPVPERTAHLDRPGLHLRLHHVTVLVQDHDRSLRFYVDQLGFKLVVDVRFGRDDRWVAVAPPDGSAMLGLVAPRADSPERGPIERLWRRMKRWWWKVAVVGRASQVVFVTEDVVAKYQEWSGRGVRFHHPPRTPHWGGTFTSFRDVDGNTFALVGRDEVTQEIEEQRRSAAEKQEAERRAVQELEIAKHVQARLFPQTMPHLRSLDYAGVCIQARQVGGDYYDFLDLGRERLGLVIADVSGKGIGAALLMANLQANVRSLSATALDQPQRLLRTVNQLFCENTTARLGEWAPSAYATLFFADYDDKERRLRYANCGHLSGLLLRSDDTLERLESTSSVLGLFTEWDCAIEERRLLSGDTLVLYTDGITESFDEAGEEFGEERLVELLVKRRELPSRALLDSIVAEVRRFSPHEQHDDITLIVARCTA